MRQTPPGPGESVGGSGAERHRPVSRLEQIVEVQRAVAVADLDLDAVMALICERTQAITGADGAAVLLPDGHRFRYGAASGYIAGQVGSLLTMKSLSGWAFLNNQPALANDTMHDPRVHAQAVRDHEMLSMLVVPLRHGGRAIGLLQVSATHASAFDEQDVQTLDLLSVVLSAAMSHASEFEALTRFRSVFDGSPIGLARLGPNAAVAEANHALADMLGYEPDELLGVSFADLTHADDAEESLACFTRLRSGGTDSCKFEQRYEQKDGTPIWCQVTATALERGADGLSDFVIVMVEDVTERKLAELALHEHTDRLGRIVEMQAELSTADLDFDASMQLVVERARMLTGSEYATIDLVEGDELVTRAATGATSDLLGYRRPLASTAASHVLAGGRAILAEHASDGPALTRPLAQALGDGSYILVPLLHAGQAVGTLSVANREGHRRLTEDDLRTTELLGVMVAGAVSRARESEAKRAQLEAMKQFEAAWSMSAIGMELIGLDGRIVAVNPAMDDVYGYTLDEYARMYVSDFTHPDDVSEVARRFFRLIKGQYEGDTCTIEARFFHKDGRLLWVRGSMSLVRDADGKPQFVLGMAENVTEQKQTELALRASEERQSRIAETQAEIAAAGLDLDAAMTLVAERSHLLTGADGAAVAIVEGDELQFVAAAGSAVIEPGTRMPLEGSLTGKAIASGRPLLVTDTSDARVYHPLAEQLGVTSIASVPLFRGGKAVGAIVGIVTDAERSLASEDVRTLDLLSVVLSSAMSSAAELEAERRQVDALQQSETIYRNSPLGIGLLDLDGCWIETNEAMRELTGRSADELASVHVSDFTHPDDVAELDRNFELLLAGKCDLFKQDLRYFRKDGGIVWAATTTTLLRDADGKPRVAVSMSENITERKLAELALAESTARFASIAETQAEVAAAGVDIERAMQLVAERSHALTRAAEIAVVIVEEDELVARALGGEAMVELGWRVPLEKAEAARRAMKTGRPVLVPDARTYSPLLAGQEHIGSLAAAPLFSADRPVGAIVAVTRRDQAPLADDDVRTLELLAIVLSAARSRAAELESERRRVESLRRFETLFRDSPTGIGLLGLDRRWLELNQATLDITGRTADEMAQLTPDDYVHPDDAPRTAAAWRRLIAGECDFYRIEARYIRPDGEIVWADSSLSMLRDENGAPQFVLVMSQDTTKRKLAELALQEKTARLARIIATQADLAPMRDLDEAMALVADRALALTGAGRAEVRLLEEDELVTKHVAGGGEPADAGSGDQVAIDAPLFRGERSVGVLSVSGVGLADDDRQTVELLGVVLSSAISSAAEVEALTRFEILYKDAPIGIGIIDLEGRLVQANQQMCDISGFTSEELAAMPVTEYTHPDDRERIVAEFVRMLRGECDSFTIEGRVIRKDGETVWTTAATSLVRDADGKPLFAIDMAQDITQQKHAELALQQNTARLARIVDTQAQVAAAGLDLEGVMRLVAERSQALTRGQGALIDLLDGDELVTRAAVGVAAGTLGNRRPASESLDALADGHSLLIGHAEIDPRLYRPIADKLAVRSLVCVPLFRSGRPVGALTVVGTDGVERLGDDDRQTLDLLGVVLSSAISRSAEYEALSQFETIYHGAPIGIGLLDLNGALVDANAAMRAINELPLVERRPISDYTHPDDVEEMTTSFRRLVRGEIDSYRNESRHLRSDGSFAWVDSSVTLLRDTAGRPRYALTMAQDVTERRSAEEQLRQSQKIEAIGQLSAGIAHDFNNLLMGVLGYAGLARGEVETDSRVGEYLDRIEKTAHRAAALTKQLLAFGRRQTLQPRALDLNELVSETLSMLERVLGEQVEIVARLDQGVPTLRADPTQLQQVLFNLALNARDAMPQGGTLAMETSTVAVGPDGLPGVDLAPGRHVLLTVTDTGVGMTSDVLEHIFEPFFTTKGVGEGTGLGLPSVYGIVKQSHGDIEVTSELGAGTTFRIYLPSADQPARLVSAVGLAPAVRPRVLVVEDAQVVRELVQTLLEEHGYEVVIADDPAHAVRLARGEPHFDVLLTDLVLARGSGADLAARIQEHEPDTRVLYMSAYEPDQRIDRDALIPKPFRNDELLEKLASMLASEAGV